MASSRENRLQQRFKHQRSMASEVKTSFQKTKTTRITSMREQILNFARNFEKLPPDRDSPNRAGRASPCEPRPLCVRLECKKPSISHLACSCRGTQMPPIAERIKLLRNGGLLSQIGNSLPELASPCVRKRCINRDATSKTGIQPQFLSNVWALRGTTRCSQETFQASP